MRFRPDTPSGVAQRPEYTGKLCSVSVRAGNARRLLKEALKQADGRNDPQPPSPRRLSSCARRQRF